MKFPKTLLRRSRGLCAFLLTTAFFVLPATAFAQFGRPVIIDDCMFYFSFEAEVEDLDGDDYQDIYLGAYSSIDGGPMMWFKNMGDTVFQVQRGFELNLRWGSQVVDLDGDGDFDIVGLSTDYSQGIIWYENDGAGEFSAHREIHNSPGSERQFLHVVDVDHDGDLDICTNFRDLNGNISVIWLENTGDMAFNTQHVLFPSVDDEHHIVSGDIDGVAGAELLIYSDEYMFALGEVQPGQPVTVDTIYHNTNEFLNLVGRIVSIVDYNNDGTNDIAWLISEGTVAGIPNMGGGTFAEEWETILPVYEARSLEFYDLDRDGDSDILTYAEVSSFSTKEVLRWYSNEAGEFEEVADLHWSYGTCLTDTSDFNQDGLVDLVGGTLDHSDGVFFFNTQYQNPDPNNPLDTLVGFYADQLRTCYDFEQGQLIDVDRDGALDFFAFSGAYSRYGWFANDGNGHFIPRFQTLTFNMNGFDPQILAVDDFDEDGDTETLVWRRSIYWDDPSYITLYDNEPGVPLTVNLLTLNPPDRFATVGTIDFPPDNQLDFYYQDWDDHLHIYRNLAGDNFQQFLDLDLRSQYGFENVLDVNMTDINQDDYADLVFVHSDNGQFALSYVLHEEDTVFADTPITIDDNLNFLFPGQPQLYDWDGDTDLDILLTGISEDESSRLVFWYENLGGLSFSSIQTLLTIPDNEEVFVFEDLNQDSRLDLISYYEADQFDEGLVLWYQQSQNGELEAPLTLAQEDGINDVFFADIDGDEDQEFFLLGEALNFWQENYLGAPRIQGQVFWDENANGQRDAGERPLNNVILTLEPDAIFSFTNPQGFYSFHANSSAYTLSAEAESCWGFTTPSSYDINLEEGVENRDFGLQLISEEYSASTYASSGPTRCGFEVPFQFYLENTGCQPLNGEAYFVLDPLTTFLDSEIMPDDIRGDTLVWSVSDLLAGDLFKVEVQMEIAGVDFIGETLQICSFFAGAGGQISDLACYASVINCAYDPNDKIVSPNRTAIYSDNLTLFSEEMLFTIRFENTGTDTAFNVVITDRIAEEFDLSSLRPIDSSHPVEVVCDAERRMVEFSFHDILLPDNTTDPSGSQGYVSYRIRTVEGLEEGTVVSNEASIFFDFNPPIITNKTRNVMVSMFPPDVGVNEVAPTAVFDLFPNPTTGNCTLRLWTGDTQGNAVIFDELGREVLRQQVDGLSTLLETNTLQSGVYFVTIHSDTGRAFRYRKLVKL